MKKSAPPNNKSRSTSQAKSQQNGRGRNAAAPPIKRNPQGIPDWRLEKPDFKTVEVARDGDVHYEVRGDLRAPAPPIRESKYLTRQQCVELSRWMLPNRKM